MLTKDMPSNGNQRAGFQKPWESLETNHLQIKNNNNKTSNCRIGHHAIGPTYLLCLVSVPVFSLLNFANAFEGL